MLCHLLRQCLGGLGLCISNDSSIDRFCYLVTKLKGPVVGDEVTEVMVGEMVGQIMKGLIDRYKDFGFYYE